MIPKEVLRNIRRIQITTSRLVTDVFAGQYQSVFKGQGMEFDEVREYQPGDEIRSIDWNVTARMGHAYVKKFVEERELTVMLVLDASLSCYVGSGSRMKRQLAAELCSVIALSADRNNDKVGLLVFTDRAEKFVPPRKGTRHVLRVVREALYFAPAQTGTDIGAALEYLNRVTKRRTITFLISDFLSPDFSRPLLVTNKRHDVVGIRIVDPAERAVPALGLVMFRDAETGEMCLTDTSDPKTRAQYEEISRARARIAEESLRSAGVDLIDVRTDRSYTGELMRFFSARARKMGRRL